jgi:hypothetical protein
MAENWLDESNHLAKVRVAGSNPVFRSQGVPGREPLFRAFSASAAAPVYNFRHCRLSPEGVLTGTRIREGVVALFGFSKRLRLIRSAMVMSTIAPVLMFLGMWVGPATSAASAATAGIKCATVSGNVNTLVKFGTCSSSKTGGSAKVSAPGGPTITFKWANGTTTSGTVSWSSGILDCPHPKTYERAIGSVTSTTNSHTSVGAALQVEFSMTSTGSVSSACGNATVKLAS